MAARLPVALAKWHAASTLGPIEPAGNVWARARAGDGFVDCPCLRCSEIDEDGIGVGRHDEEVG